MIHVLLIDDEKELGEIARTFLQVDGKIEVTLATSAMEGLELLNAKEVDFDVIVSDYQMPKMNGIGLLKKIRADGSDLPFILFTGRGREDVVIEALNSGADGYLQKGGNPRAQFAELNHRIETVVAKHRAEKTIRGAELALRDSEEKFRATLLQSVDGIVIFDDKLEILEWSHALTGITGYARDEVVGRNLILMQDMLRPPEMKRTEIFADSTGKAALEALGRKAEGAWSISQEAEVVCKGGDRKTLHVDAFRVTLRNRVLYGSIIRDVTESKKAEAAIIEANNSLSKRTNALRILNRVIVAANESNGLQELFGRTVHEILLSLNFDGGGIYLMNNSDMTAELVFSVALPSDFVRSVSKVSINGPPYDKLFIHGESVVSDHYDQIHPSFSEMSHILSMASVPLTSKGKVIGALNVGSHKRHIISPEELYALLSIGREIGGSIERMAAEEAVKDGAKDISRLLDSITEMVFILSMDGNIIDVNKTVEQKLHYAKGELIGSNVLMVHVPEGREEALRVVQGMVAGTVDACHVPVITKEGKALDVETKVTRGQWRGRDVLIGVTRDVSDRTKAERALRDSEAKYRQMFNSINDGVQLSVLLPNGEPGKFIECNDVACRMLGLSREEMTQLTPFDFVEGEHNPPLPDVLRSIREDGTAEFQTTHRRKDGTTFPVEVNVHVIELDGSKAVLAVVRDITERVAAERELSMQLAEIFEANESLRQITADLRASEAALKRVSRQLSILNSITRHDVLNQATIISGYSSIMREDLVEQSQKDMAEKINRSAEVIRHQMEFAKMYQGIGVEAPTWHPLSRCVEKAAASLEMGGLRVIDLCGEYSVRADPMFEKVIYNLLDNCLRHSKGASRIWFRVSEEAGNLVLTVRDDGHGISAGDREHLFERGYGKNSGYGLFLSREILGITGISIEEKSGPGEGAAFVITIPPEDWKRA